MENKTISCTANIDGGAYVLFVTLNALSSCLATTGNIAVPLAVYKTPSLRTVSNFFICSLAMADLLVGLLVNPMYIAVVTLRVWVSNHPLYRVENYLWIQSLTLTTFSLSAISIDRYIAVTKVFRYQQIMTGRRCATIISTIWSFSAIIAIFAFLVAPEYPSEAWIAGVMVSVCLPLLVMGYSYFHIFREAKNQTRKIQVATGTNIAEVRETFKNKKAALSIAIVIGLFLCLFAPNFVFSIVEITTKEPCKKLAVYRNWLWAIWLALSSSACNPWVYAIRSREYREAYKKIYKPGCKSTT